MSGAVDFALLGHPSDYEHLSQILTVQIIILRRMNVHTARRQDGRHEIHVFHQFVIDLARRKLLLVGRHHDRRIMNRLAPR